MHFVISNRVEHNIYHLLISKKSQMKTKFLICFDCVQVSQKSMCDTDNIYVNVKYVISL